MKQIKGEKGFEKVQKIIDYSKVIYMQVVCISGCVCQWVKQNKEANTVIDFKEDFSQNSLWLFLIFKRVYYPSFH